MDRFPASPATAADDSSLTRAAAILPGLTDDLRKDNEAAAVVTERIILNTGREFEYGYRCDADPSRAEAAATAHAKHIDYMRSPCVRQISRTEWSVRWWGLD